MPLPLPALSSLVPAVANNQDDDKKSAPAYLYCKRKIYYFRYAFPANLRKSLGRAELRVSLQTSYLRIARFRARMLSAEIGNMILEGFMLDYKEIRRRMNILLQRLLEQDHADLSERKNISMGKLNITYDQLRTSQIELLLHCNSPQLLEQIAPECIVDLLRSGAFTRNELAGENYLQIVKAYKEMQITRHRIDIARTKGDFLMEEEVMGRDFGKLPCDISCTAQEPPALLEVPTHIPQQQQTGGILYSEAMER